MIFFFAVLLGLSYAQEGSWDFLVAFVRVLTVHDLTPNIGYFWYAFAEIHERFSTWQAKSAASTISDGFAF